MNGLIEIQDLRIHRQGRLVLSIDRLDVEEGEILAVIGPNGAGKSTLLLALAHLLKPTEGRINFRGQPVMRDLVYRRRIALGGDHAGDRLAAGRHTVNRAGTQVLRHHNLAILSGDVNAKKGAAQDRSFSNLAGDAPAA